ncbi:hypothetical protein CY34DRAFT_749415 [Suillus luteus UH-Slu-Lm8-n1]|uniref:Uncharacterized protein n=1 Tax=Suillus luteus UH-Slu-Lm8-n1 TaxID=930992 RepID=A0A0D0BI90_9AGAM|nr:hypothetical protein CY34DRAFT_749415 [Suillus luteus UH-Slu-Lm8-n1]
MRQVLIVSKFFSTPKNLNFDTVTASWSMYDIRNAYSRKTDLAIECLVMTHAVLDCSISSQHGSSAALIGHAYRPQASFSNLRSHDANDWEGSRPHRYRWFLTHKYEGVIRLVLIAVGQPWARGERIRAMCRVVSAPRVIQSLNISVG